MRGSRQAEWQPIKPQYQSSDGGLVTRQHRHNLAARRRPNLVEMVAISYQVDQGRNWTERTISAWDPATNDMVDVPKDTRILTYY